MILVSEFHLFCLRGMNILLKGDNCENCFAPFRKEKEFNPTTPPLRSNFFLLEQTPFWKQLMCRRTTLRKHAYSNILNILTSKKWKFSDKNSNISHTSGQNIECGYSLELPRWGSSNEYPQSMLLGRNRKNNVYPCKPQFYYKKVGFKGVSII